MIWNPARSARLLFLLNSIFSGCFLPSPICRFGSISERGDSHSGDRSDPDRPEDHWYRLWLWLWESWVVFPCIQKSTWDLSFIVAMELPRWLPGARSNREISEWRMPSNSLYNQEVNQISRFLVWVAHHSKSFPKIRSIQVLLKVN